MVSNIKVLLTHGVKEQGKEGGDGNYSLNSAILSLTWDRRERGRRARKRKARALAKMQALSSSYRVPDLPLEVVAMTVYSADIRYDAYRVEHSEL